MKRLPMLVACIIYSSVSIIGNTNIESVYLMIALCMYSASATHSLFRPHFVHHSRGKRWITAIAVTVNLIARSTVGKKAETNKDGRHITCVLICSEMSCSHVASVHRCKVGRAKRGKICVRGEK